MNSIHQREYQAEMKRIKILIELEVISTRLSHALNSHSQLLIKEQITVALSELESISELNNEEF